MILLDVAGPRLVDPGTGAYHSHPELRERLRATAAHNTVEVDGRSAVRPGRPLPVEDAAPHRERRDLPAAEDGAIEAGARRLRNARRSARASTRVRDPRVRTRSWSWTTSKGHRGIARSCAGTSGTAFQPTVPDGPATRASCGPMDSKWTSPDSVRMPRCSRRPRQRSGRPVSSSPGRAAGSSSRRWVAAFRSRS